MERFVSALGPDLPGEPDVRYRKSTRTFSEALEARVKQEDKLRGTAFTTVIYRLSYDSAKDKFYSWRQTLLEERYEGNEKGDAQEPDVALAYEIFTAPLSSLDGGGAELSKQINLIATHSQIDKPTNAGPPK